MKKFIGRQSELEQLERLANLQGPSIAVIKGRRRIGKSRLAEEFGKGKIFISFSGLAPTDNVTAQNQRDHFAAQLCERFKLPPFTFSDWNDGFAHLTRYLKQKTTILLLDEISWMGSKDPTFIPKLKVWWDIALQKYPKLVLILCGSISTWIETNIVNSTAFFGRITLELDLEELTLPESYKFLKEIGVKSSSYDLFKILSILGGIPWYLEKIDPSQAMDENIKRLCFRKNGLLVNEFDKIFHDLFESRGEIYKKILHALSNGMKTLSELRNEIHYSQGGPLSRYMKTLRVSGFVSQHYSWGLKTGTPGKQSLYRLCDNYTRFFIKYIENNLAKIQKNTYNEFSISALPGWESMMGFQVENFILKNRHILLKSLGVYPQDIVADNPYVQRPTSRQKGCQIDYLIQTHANNLFVCEFKFTRKELGSRVVEAMKDKIKRFTTPKGFGICPVLVHLGGVSDSVHDKQYFYRIIDIEDFLENNSQR